MNQLHTIKYHTQLWAPVLFAALLLVACAPMGPAAAPQTAATPTPAQSENNGQVPLPTLTSEPASSAQLPAQVSLQLSTVAEGLASPLYMTHAGDGSGRLFIVEKGGTIRIFVDGSLLPQPFLDITDRVNSAANERGLLGLAFPPNYRETGHFFVNYTDSAGDTVVSRFQVSDADGNLADPAHEFLVLSIAQPAPNHDGGMLLFGPDGYLWMGTGDGGAAMDRFGNGQNPNTLLGKMLRLDVTSDPTQPYLIPPDNPWVTDTWNGAEVEDEIWAVGLRNPWRYSFDRETGDLWIADVGQNRFEEVNLVPAGSDGGLNFGWPIMEGLHCVSEPCDQEGLHLPLVEYANGGGDCSVTGGYVYRGVRFPHLHGVYFFGDYCSGRIWATRQADQGQWDTVQVLENAGSLSSFGEDEAGELYLTDLSHGTVAELLSEP